MRLKYSLVTGAIYALTHGLCRLHGDQLSRIPAHGPLILVANHINFLEVPLLYTHLRPRPITGFAKAESWDTPALRILMDLWGAIPLHRGEVDLTALRAGLAALEAGKILAVAPEGTRTGDGRLRRANPGIAWLALHSGAPLMPMAFYGGEHFWTNLRRVRRTDFHVAVGAPFCLAPAEPGRPAQALRQAMADAIMARIAALLPDCYHGAYANQVADLNATPFLRPCAHELIAG